MRVFLAALVMIVLVAPVEAKGKKTEKVERYPASFRLKVQEAIDRGVHHLRQLQNGERGWGSPTDIHALGHSSLPLLAMLKAGVPGDDPQVVAAFKALRKMEKKSVYGVGCYLMALHARYAPKLDTFDTDIGTDRAKHVKPDETWASITEEDRKEVEDSLAYLLRAQNARGLWHYHAPEDKNATGYDLSNTQYGVLGLRAAADCGAKVKARVWRDTLHGLLSTQVERGEELRLQEREVRDGYVFLSSCKAQARGFPYKDDKKNGPKGKNTIAGHPQTGSMTTAGVACVAICREGLWRTRKFSGSDRKASKRAIRDGLAWMQVNFSVTKNPGHPNGSNTLYYLYGMERMGMLTGTRWLGTHDWYYEGAKHLLELAAENGSWGGHVANAFAILFLKRATSPAARVVTTD